ncbi:1-phosphofructokinase [Lacticaseibacillus chiayiensis]|uniref:Tagatose-6-phosphate kinase n=1 Tax=Lacticaseibacillus chiayiensis TaxID=2100821 RepID=A0A4Q1U6T4_9LACO|nr:1-phosphofructokinase [Lacticaseibacillus chiayiensis]QVI36072.1 1-phosphofructokinase [Lacticaseibacillus chiayiensis]RXT27021.1 1-phosphofructokinase [Lacticaseibacillus chiayiensis]UYN57875.1 1-phosphofructokinase [Lacticaseibacillus chiayiensis]
MIYTLTLNPAIDLFIKTQTMAPNTVNRTDSYDIQANGKGVNVSCILKRRGVDNVALGVGGGFTLDYIADFLTQQGIRNHFYKDAGFTRINVFTRVVSDDTEYKLVNPGPEISPATLKQLYQQLSTLGADDWLCVSGSFAQGIAPGFLLQLGALSQERGFQLIIDSAYPEAVKALAYRPLLVKPNDVELMSWFGQSGVTDLSTMMALGHRALDAGAQNILVSLGAAGALFMNREVTLVGNAPKIDVLNTAGAGDTMLGTFLAGLYQKQDLAATLKLSIAAGSDTARRAWITDFTQTDELLTQIEIKQLEG